MTAPLVSVCVVTYNHERYIRNCIMSVVAQSSDVTLEILVGDDLSEDATSAIVAELVGEYPHLIRHFRHTPRLGPTGNYLSLVREARGDFIAYLDGDDFWLPGKLAAQIFFLEQHRTCSAVYSNALVITDDGVPFGVFNNPQPTQFDINGLLRHGNFLNHSSMCYRSSLREYLLALPEPFLDYRVNLCHAQYGAIGYLNQILVGYRVSSSSSIISHANNFVRRLYWEALLDLPRSCVNPDDLAGGMAEFARSVFFRSLRVKDASLLRQWLPTVMAAAPVTRARMGLLIVAAVVRVGIQEIISAFCAWLDGNRLKILYRR